jgi:PPOX class probable F420-dependent enzyme
MTRTRDKAKLTDRQAALFRGRNWGVLTTLREDGSPHSTPVWVDTDGENVLFNTAVGRAKERHLRHDPRASIAVLPADDQQAGYVSVTGTAQLEEEGAVEHIHELSRKYIGKDYPWLGPDEERVIVTIRPERIDSQGV